MVSILRALKVTLFYFIPILVSVLAFILGLTAITDINISINGNVLVFQSLGLAIGLIIGGGFLAILFIIKAVGDIAEEALTYYE